MNPETIQIVYIIVNTSLGVVVSLLLIYIKTLIESNKALTEKLNSIDKTVATLKTKLDINSNVVDKGFEKRLDALEQRIAKLENNR